MVLADQAIYESKFRITEPFFGCLVHMSEATLPFIVLTQYRQRESVVMQEGLHLRVDSGYEPLRESLG